MPAWNDYRTHFFADHAPAGSSGTQQRDLDLIRVAQNEFLGDLLDDERRAFALTGKIIAEKRNAYFLVIHVWQTLIVARSCNTGGIADDSNPVGDIFRNYRPRPDACVFADSDAGQN